AAVATNSKAVNPGDLDRTSSRTISPTSLLGLTRSSVLKSLPMNHLPKHQEGKLFSSRLLLLALLCLAGTACSTTAPTGKILFEDPRGSVSLQTFSKPSIQASHPINLEPALLAQLLTGLEIDDGGVGAHHMKSMQSSVTGTVAISPLFSEDQVQFL